MNDRANFDPEREILAAADGLATLATAYASAGRDDEADDLYRLCADLELQSPGLQACWGGPLNGQEGRRRILEDLILRYRPTCLLETGTFRGLTTGWLAQRFAEPILTCEASKRYFYQAERNLAGHAHVCVTLADSRTFLTNVDLAEAARNRPLIYLDAHWEHDLPLREELQIIAGNFETFVAVIDDFRVPGDDGYSWDDYGEGNALTIEYIAAAGMDDCRVLFPTLPSADETGARRGCCVVSRHVPVALEDSGLLKGGTLQHWRRLQAAYIAAGGSLPSTTQPRQATDAFDPRLASYPDQIVYLQQHLTIAQGEVIAKEAVIQDLKRVCDERQRVIEELAQALHVERSKH